MRLPLPLSLALLLPSALLLGSCSRGESRDSGSSSSGSGSGTGSISFAITDAPLDPALVERAVIAIDRIRVHRRADGDSGFDTVWEGAPMELDLTELRNGVTRTIDAGELPVGSYRQVRLHVTSALLELKNGRTFSTADGSIRLTSQDTSGYKVFLEPEVVIEEDVTTTVILDFQMARTFSPVPASRPEDANFMHLHPSVRAAVAQETGELRGVVTRRDGDNLVPVDGAAVYVFEPGVSDPDQAVASTLGDATGSGAFIGIQPGTYDVEAVVGDESGTATDVVVTRGDVTSFEIVIE